MNYSPKGLAGDRSFCRSSRGYSPGEAWALSPRGDADVGQFALISKCRLAKAVANSNAMRSTKLSRLKLVETEGGQVTCRRCGAPLQSRHGKFVVKYFLLRTSAYSSQRAAQKQSLDRSQRQSLDRSQRQSLDRSQRQSLDTSYAEAVASRLTLVPAEGTTAFSRM